MKLWKITRKYVTIKKSNTFYIGQNKHSDSFIPSTNTCMYVRVYRWCVGIVGPLASLAGCHRSWRHHTLSHGWSVGIVGSLAGCQRSWRHNSRMVGPLASLAAWPPEVMTSHALAWLVRWHRWSVGIVGRLPEVMTHVQLSHGWSVGIVGPLAGCQRSWRHSSLMVLGPLASLASLAGCQSSWRHTYTLHGWSGGRLPEVMTSHTLASGTWSVGIVVPLASLAGCQIGHDVTIEVTL